MSQKGPVQKGGHRREGRRHEPRLLPPCRSRRRHDFGAWFHVAAPNCVHQVVTNDENLFHNLTYLNSYIHDARTAPNQMRRQGRSLVIPIIRDRWELYRHLGKLDTVASSLKIGPILGLDWCFDHATFGRVLNDRYKWLWIVDVAVDEESTWHLEDVTRLIVRGPPKSWRLVVTVPAARWRVDLRDAR
jgi:hypothetical protein